MHVALITLWGRRLLWRCAQGVQLCHRVQRCCRRCCCTASSVNTAGRAKCSNAAQQIAGMLTARSKLQRLQATTMHRGPAHLLVSRHWQWHPHVASH